MGNILSIVRQDAVTVKWEYPIHSLHVTTTRTVDGQVQDYRDNDTMKDIVKLENTNSQCPVGKLYFIEIPSTVTNTPVSSQSIPPQHHQHPLPVIILTYHVSTIFIDPRNVLNMNWNAYAETRVTEEDTVSKATYGGHMMNCVVSSPVFIDSAIPTSLASSDQNTYSITVKLTPLSDMLTQQANISHLCQSFSHYWKWSSTQQPSLHNDTSIETNTENSSTNAHRAASVDTNTTTTHLSSSSPLFELRPLTPVPAATLPSLSLNTPEEDKNAISVTDPNSNNPSSSESSIPINTPAISMKQDMGRLLYLVGDTREGRKGLSRKEFRRQMLKQHLQTLETQAQCLVESSGQQLTESTAVALSSIRNAVAALAAHSPANPIEHEKKASSKATSNTVSSTKESSSTSIASTVLVMDAGTEPGSPRENSVHENDIIVSTLLPNETIPKEESGTVRSDNNSGKSNNNPTETVPNTTKSIPLNQSGSKTETEPSRAAKSVTNDTTYSTPNYHAPYSVPHSVSSPRNYATNNNCHNPSSVEVNNPTVTTNDTINRTNDNHNVYPSSSFVNRAGYDYSMYSQQSYSLSLPHGGYPPASSVPYYTYPSNYSGYSTDGNVGSSSASVMPSMMIPHSNNSNAVVSPILPTKYPMIPSPPSSSTMMIPSPYYAGSYLPAHPSPNSYPHMYNNNNMATVNSSTMVPSPMYAPSLPSGTIATSNSSSSSATITNNAYIFVPYPVSSLPNYQ